MGEICDAYRACIPFTPVRVEQAHVSEIGHWRGAIMTCPLHPLVKPKDLAGKRRLQTIVVPCGGTDWPAEWILYTLGTYGCTCPVED